jgi:hypothetical protein
MHVRELVEVAGLVAFHGPTLIAAPESAQLAYLEQYWSASRSRFDSWSRALKAYPSAVNQDSRQALDAWVEIRGAIDEIFTSELLVRVWTAVLVVGDQRRGEDVAAPIARNVLAAHMDIRRRALELLVAGTGLSIAQSTALNRLRRRTERWSDMLVGGLAHCGEVLQFAVEPDRALDFGSDLGCRREAPGGRQAWRLTLIALRGAFHTGLSPIAANGDANARIVAAILGCFSEDLFDSTGLFQSLWMMRLSATASDVQGLVSDLLEPKPRRLPAFPSAAPRFKRG